jgi:hypothetical protein
MQQAGYQVQDFIVQVQGSLRWWRSLSRARNSLVHSVLVVQ